MKFCFIGDPCVVKASEEISLNHMVKKSTTVRLILE